MKVFKFTWIISERLLNSKRFAMAKIVLFLHFSALMGGFVLCEINQEKLRVFENFINNTFNDFIANLSDPYVLRDVVLKDEDNTILSGFLNVSKLSLEGVKDVVLSKIYLSDDRHIFNITVEVPSIEIYSKYQCDLLFKQLLLPIYGKGIASAYLEKVSLILTGLADVEQHSLVKNFSVSITLQEASFHFDGLLDNPEFNSILDLIINRHFVGFVNGNEGLVSKLMSPILEHIINEYIWSDDGELY